MKLPPVFVRFTKLFLWSMAGFAALLLFFPMPHGGTLGGNFVAHIVWEMTTAYQNRSAPGKNNTAQDDGLLSTVSRKKANPVALDPALLQETSSPMWKTGNLGALPVWLEVAEGRLWSAGQPEIFPSWWDAAAIEEAMRLCRKLPPAGSWMLPEGRDFDRAQRSGLDYLGAEQRQRWLTFLPLEGGAVVPALRGWAAATEGEPVRFRCIAVVGQAGAERKEY